MTAVHLSRKIQNVEGIFSSVETLESEGIVVQRPFVKRSHSTEPFVRYGLFVINTEAEIIQAAQDYRNERMGSIDF